MADKYEIEQFRFDEKPAYAIKQNGKCIATAWNCKGAELIKAALLHYQSMGSQIMADGIGCTCYAYYSGECACDADWTSQEVIDLKKENERLKEKLRRQKAKHVDNLLKQKRTKEYIVVCFQ